MTENPDHYELEERAAIREVDGGHPHQEAELLAAAEIQDRQQQEARDVPSLQEQRDQVGEKLRTATDPEKKAALYEQWQDLNRRIIEARRNKKE